MLNWQLLVYFRGPCNKLVVWQIDLVDEGPVNSFLFFCYKSSYSKIKLQTKKPVRGQASDRGHLPSNKQVDLNLKGLESTKHKWVQILAEYLRLRNCMLYKSKLTELFPMQTSYKILSALSTIGGRAPVDGVRITQTLYQESLDTTIVFYVLASAGMLFCLFCLLLNFVYRKHR